MKMSLRIIGVFLIFTLLISCVTATENKDLPTKEEINYFIAGIPVSDNYVITVFNTVKDKQPAWNCDTWVDQDGNQILSLYYVDPDSTKGYGSIYFNEFGKEISMLGVKARLVNHYVGKAVSEEYTHVDTTSEEYTHVGTTSKETTHVGTTSKETTHVGTTSEETTHVDTPADSTKEESATNQEESESIQKLSEAVQELSESIQQQSDSVQRQTDSVQQQSETDNQQSDPVQRQSETDNQQSDPVQRQSETDNQQSDPNQKTILSKFFSYDIIIKCLCYPLLVYFIAHKKGWVK